MKSEEVIALFYGDIHGVGFRYYVKRLAEEMSLYGYVKNEDDGSVEVVAVGERKALEHFIEKIKKNAPGKITDVTIKYSEIKKTYNNQFTIQF